uniref:Uncharacterized protein n=1 Tax=viral metagenome TaxID=1070528 RepID=A0A2V0R9K1_9ZZZZ
MPAFGPTEFTLVFSEIVPVAGERRIVVLNNNSDTDAWISFTATLGSNADQGILFLKRSTIIIREDDARRSIRARCTVVNKFHSGETIW